MVDVMPQPPQSNQPAAPVMPIAPAAANQTSMRTGGFWNDLGNSVHIGLGASTPAQLQATADAASRVANFGSTPRGGGMVTLPTSAPGDTSGHGPAHAPAIMPVAPPVNNPAVGVAANGRPLYAPPSTSFSDLAANLIHPLTALATSHALKNMAAAAAPPAAAANSLSYDPNTGPTHEQAQQITANQSARFGEAAPPPAMHPGEHAVVNANLHTPDSFARAVTGMPWSRALQLVQALHPPSAQEQAMRLALQSAPNQGAAAKMIHMWSAPQSYIYGGMQDPFASQPTE